MSGGAGEPAKQQTSRQASEPAGGPSRWAASKRGVGEPRTDGGKQPSESASGPALIINKAKADTEAGKQGVQASRGPARRRPSRDRRERGRV